MMFLHPRVHCKTLFKSAVRIVSAASHPQRDNSYGTNASNSTSQKQTLRKLAPYIASLTALGGAYYLFELGQAKRNLPEFRHEHRRFDLPNFTLKEIQERRDLGRIWSIYGRGVYDLTEYAKRHPGGEEMIAMAAGALLEPFFVEYNFHRRPEIFELLETMRVGNLVHSHVRDYHHRHHHHHHHHRHQHHQQDHLEKPDRCKTPKVFPKVDPKSYRLELVLEGEKFRALTLQDLEMYPTHSIVSSIPCKNDSKQKEEANASGTESTWTGARLCDILKDLTEGKNLSEYDEVEFQCLDNSESGNGSYNTRVKLNSVLPRPDEKTSPELEVLLAYKRDGAELEPKYGYPVRAIIPQLSGSRNVKWLGKIILKKMKPSFENAENK